jgi:exopolysaccharide biosynthesis polyprenyl glycosylphosphotransferase
MDSQISPKAVVSDYNAEPVTVKNRKEERPLPVALRFSERKFLLAAGDLIVVNGALLWVLGLRIRRDDVFGHFISDPVWFLILSALWLLCAQMTGGYHLIHAIKPGQSMLRGIGAALLACGLYSLTPFVTPVLPTSRFQLLSLPTSCAIGIGLWRCFYALVFVHPGFQQRAIVVGAGKAGRTLLTLVNELGLDKKLKHQAIGYHVVGFIDDHQSMQGQIVEGAPVLGTRKDLVALAKEHRADEVVVAITFADAIHSELFEAILECREMGLTVTHMSRVYEQLSGRVPVEHAGRNLSVTMPVTQSPMHRFYLGGQRVFDIAIALFGCVLLACIIPFVWLLNRIGSPGPLFYSQERVGRNGHPFIIHKFRSMIVDAEKNSGAVWAAESDPRITKVGNFLRKTRLDEIPQFWNVLCGHMSVIGPRPERPSFVSQLAKDIPFYRVRHAVKPGLTGWAQVRYRYGASVEDSLIKLQYDLYYIKHQGVLLDLEILAKTIGVVLGFKGR